MITRNFNINDNNEKIIHNAYGKYIIFDLINFEYAILNKDECRDLLRRKERISVNKEEQNIVEVYPVFVTGFDCNYRCSYCYQSEYEKDIPKMKKEDIVNIKAFYSEYERLYGVKLDIKDIGIFGGEPFLDSNYDFIKAVFEEFSESKVTFISNGANIEPFYPLLVKYKDRISIVLSVDGDKELHLKYRHTSKDFYYDNIWGSINFFKKENISFEINTIFHEEEINSYPRYFDVLEKNNLLNEDFSITLSSDINNDKNKDYINNIKEGLLKVKLLDERSKYMRTDILNYSYMSILRRIHTREYLENYKTCDITNSPSYTFLPTGEIVPCIIAHSHGITVGRFKPESYIDRAMVSRLTGRDFRHLNKCKNCEKRYFCRGGCIVEAIASKADEDYYCGRWNEDDYEQSFKEALETLILEEIKK